MLQTMSTHVSDVLGREIKIDLDGEFMFFRPITFDVIEKLADEIQRRDEKSIPEVADSLALIGATKDPAVASAIADRCIRVIREMRYVLQGFGLSRLVSYVTTDEGMASALVHCCDYSKSKIDEEEVPAKVFVLTLRSKLDKKIEQELYRWLVASGMVSPVRSGGDDKKSGGKGGDDKKSGGKGGASTGETSPTEQA